MAIMLQGGVTVAEVARHFGASRGTVIGARDEFGFIPGAPAPTTTTHPDRKPIKWRHEA